jgi:hypothetical protein
MLSPYLNRTDLIKIIACIEATLPFRRPSEEGKLVAEQQRDKLKSLLSKVNISYNDEFLDDLVLRSVRVSNLDVNTFGSKDTGFFLHNTWALILEGNAVLRSQLSQFLNIKWPSKGMKGFLGF